MSAPPLRMLVGAAICAALLVVPTALGARPGADSRTTQGTGYASQALVEMNAARRARGLRPLRLHRGLARAAAAHGRRMAQNGYFGHSGAGEGSIAARIRRYYKGSTVGEAIVWHESEFPPQQAVAAWLASPVHRAILLNRRFRHVGIAAFRVPSAPGVYSGLDATIVVADFGAP